MDLRDRCGRVVTCVAGGLCAALLVVTLGGCGGGGSDSGGGGSTAPPSGSGGATPSTGGGPSNNHPASGFYEQSVQVTVSGADNYSARLRVVIDPGGGVAVFENGVLQGQARMVASQFRATAQGVTETLSGLSCTGVRSYVASVVNTNARVQGNLSGNFTCAGGQNIRLTSAFDLPRTGDHQ